VGFHDGYLSDLVGRRTVVAGDRVPFGRVVDFLVGRPDEVFPRIDGVVVRIGRERFFAPIATVAETDDSGAVVLSERPTHPAPSGDAALYLVDDLLDKQIVDVDGRKVVRINDVELANVGETLRVVAADVGIAGLLRRLGLSALARGIVRRNPRGLIAWSSVAPLSDLNPANVRLSVSENRLARLHPSDLAEIVGELSTHDAARVIRGLDDETAADAFEHLESERQRAIIDDLGTARAADIIEEMDADDAADLLGDLSEERQRELLAEMEPTTAGELRALVEYDERTAGGLMTTDYVWIYPHRTVGATIEKIREIGPSTEFVYYLYVTDERRTLLGAMSLRTLLLASPAAFIHQVMATGLVSVGPETAAAEVASVIARYDLLAVPVLDDAGAMLGIVTVDDAIDAIMPERFARNLPAFTRRRERARRDRPDGGERA